MLPRLSELQNTGFVVLDTETTGLVNRSKRHRAWEITLLNLRFCAETQKWLHTTHTFQVDVHPSGLKGLKLSQTYSDYMSSTTAENRKGLPSMDKVLSRVRGIVGNKPVVAHNVKFDKAVVSNEAEKCGVTDPLGRNMWHCTLEAARSGGHGVIRSEERPSHYHNGTYTKTWRSHRLADVAASFGIDFDENKWHTSKYDALVTMQIFLKLVKLNERQLKEAETARNRELFQSKVAELEAELGRVYIPLKPEKVDFPWVSSAITAMLVLTGFGNSAENIAFFWAIPFGWYAIAKFKSLEDYPSKVREWEEDRKKSTQERKEIQRRLSTARAQLAAIDS